jgi:tRNA(Ile)-lysidine synthase
MHSLERKLSEELQRINAGSLLLAISGGPDSVAMLQATLRVWPKGAGSIAVAHFNHRLRPDSDADEQFVVQLCSQVGVECHVGRAESNLREQGAGVGLEAAARAARYEYLGQLAEQQNVDCILTAHTASDQVETVLHRILRGTGLRGLKGIQRVRPLGERSRIVRPLLDISREEVLDYLSSLGQSACQDSTNAQNKQTRNRIRNELLPLLRQDYNPDVSSALLRLADMAGELDSIVHQAVGQVMKEAVKFIDGDSVEICASAIAAAAPYVVRQLLIEIWHRQGWAEREMDHAQWATLERMILVGQPSSRSLPGGVRAKRRGEQLLLTRPREDHV